MEGPQKRSEKEKELEDELDIPRGHIIIDVPKRELFLSEPRIDKVEIPVLYDKEIVDLMEITPIARAIKEKKIPDWYLMVVVDEKYRKKVTDRIEKLILR
ncbi:MAG: hypothetical protein DRN18_03650 [Thermoplasmata archaeon]|nr:MAG: hypothetical protein DRN18_03650 [Thermoplasmata archaeon]